MRRPAALLLALLLVAPVGAVLGTGSALAAATGPALVPGAADGSVRVRAGSLDASDRWIVVLRPDARPDTASLRASARASALGIRQDRVFTRGAVRGYAARLTSAQLALLRSDPSVEAVVPDEIVSLAAQTTPTGVSRVYGPLSTVGRGPDGSRRVDADVAIVDTGIDPHHEDLDVAGGISCSTSSPSDWSDANGHGTHVAGIVGALDNGRGVVGVAPGARLWSVKILDPAGNGLLSWYVCGLEWIAAQRDPGDPSWPLFEAVNMSVTKPGRDDGDCGEASEDVMHRAVCAVVASGTAVVAAAGNDGAPASGWVPAAYSEVITVSALADTDGRPGGLGGSACLSWGGYDQDDTFADFSNYGPAVDMIAPGKCILSTLPGDRYGVLSGTSMAAPLVAGAAALWASSRPGATPAQVRAALISTGSSDWKVSTDPDPTHEPLLDVSWIVDAGDFALRSLAAGTTVGAAGATLHVAMAVARAEDLALPVDLTASVAAPLTAEVSPERLDPGSASALTVTVVVPPGTPSGTYPVTVTASDGTRQRSAVHTVAVDSTPPVATPPALTPYSLSVLGANSYSGLARWAPASDAEGGVTGYQAQWAIDGRWGPVVALDASVRLLPRTFTVGHAYALRLRARDAAGNWSPWATSLTTNSFVVQDTARGIVRTGTWYRVRSSLASGGTVLSATSRGASYTYRFAGRGIAIVAPRAPGRGIFDVYVDGTRRATVDERWSSYQGKRLLFVMTGLASGTHTLRVVARSTPGRQRIELDALLVLR